MTDHHDEKDAAVGYRRPPVRTRFRKGQSGNPRGRPKGSKNLITDLLEELSELIPIREAGKERRVSKQRAFVKSLIAAALKGDGRATAALVSLCARAFPDRPNENGKDEKLSSLDDHILQRFIDREVDRRRLTVESISIRPEADPEEEKLQ